MWKTWNWKSEQLKPPNKLHVISKLIFSVYLQMRARTNAPTNTRTCGAFFIYTYINRHYRPMRLHRVFDDSRCTFDEADSIGREPDTLLLPPGGILKTHIFLFPCLSWVLQYKVCNFPVGRCWENQLLSV